MAATAQTLVSAAVPLGYEALSSRMLLLCLVGWYASQSSLTAQAAAVGAAQNQYGALSDKQLGQCLLDVLS